MELREERYNFFDNSKLIFRTNKKSWLKLSANLMKRKRKLIPRDTLYPKYQYIWSMKVSFGAYDSWNAERENEDPFSLRLRVCLPFPGDVSTIVISCRFSITFSAWAVALPLLLWIPFLACPAAKVKKMLNFLSLLAKISYMFALHSAALLRLKLRIKIQLLQHYNLYKYIRN